MAKYAQGIPKWALHWGRGGAAVVFGSFKQSWLKAERETQHKTTGQKL
jgi:hypothetical protein